MYLSLCTRAFYAWGPDAVMSTVCSWDLVVCAFVFQKVCFPITPQVFALLRRTHNNDSMKVSCIFRSSALSPNNAKSRKALAPAGPEVWIMVKRKLTVGGLICYLASVAHFHCVCVCLFVSHMQFLYGISSQVLCCPISIASRKIPEGTRPEHLHFPNKTI